MNFYLKQWRAVFCHNENFWTNLDSWLLYCAATPQFFQTYKQVDLYSFFTMEIFKSATLVFNFFKAQTTWLTHKLVFISYEEYLLACNVFCGSESVEMTLMATGLHVRLSLIDKKPSLQSGNKEWQTSTFMMLGGSRENMLLSWTVGTVESSFLLDLHSSRELPLLHHVKPFSSCGVSHRSPSFMEVNCLMPRVCLLLMIMPVHYKSFSYHHLVQHNSQ